MIKSLILVFCTLACQILCQAQVTLDPSNGKELDLTGQLAQKPDTIPTSKLVYQKPATSTLKISSHIVYNIDIYIDPKKWDFKKTGDTIEYKFFRAGTPENVGLLISEQNQTLFPSIVEQALNNARKAAADVKVIKEEYRKVNGRTVLFLQFKASMMGVSFTYSNYYYTSDLGTIQFLTYTITDLAPKNEQDLEDLLNGLVVGK